MTALAQLLRGGSLGDMAVFAQFLRGYSIPDMAIGVVILAAVIALVFLAMHVFKVTPPPWVIHAAWIVIAAGVIIFCIRLVSSM